MRVFITGGTGFIGSAVVKELISAGHEVLGLSRSAGSDAALAALGAQSLRGSLEDLDSLRKGAGASDGVVHLGFIHDFSNFAKSCEIDKAAIETLGDALLGKPLVVAAGIAGVRPGAMLTEDYANDRDVSPRQSEQAALALKGVTASAVRLPPAVYGDGKAGFVSILLDFAIRTGVSAYIGEGQNRWSTVHYRDAAKVFALALGKSGVFHAVSDEGITVKEIAEFIGQKLNIPAASKSQDEATAHFGGFFGVTAALDCPASSAITQAALGWKPTELGLFQEPLV